MGAQGVLYGDKVINIANARRYDVVDSGFQKVKNAYLANGEIGLVVGQFKGKNWKPKGLPWKIEVEFSSQLGIKFGFGGLDFGDRRSVGARLRTDHPQGPRQRIRHDLRCDPESLPPAFSRVALHRIDAPAGTSGLISPDI